MNKYIVAIDKKEYWTQAKSLQQALLFASHRKALSMDKELIAKIEHVIYELVMSKSYSNNRQADHFIKLKKRVVEGKHLTKKMRENLAWIKENVVREELK